MFMNTVNHLVVQQRMVKGFVCLFGTITGECRGKLGGWDVANFDASVFVKELSMHDHLSIEVFVIGFRYGERYHILEGLGL